MLFNSLSFLVFFAIELGLHYLPLPWRVKKLNLLLASYLFYAAWSPPFVILLWISTVVDWQVARWMAGATSVTGKLQIEAGVTHIIVHRLWVPQLQHHPAPTKSRDFH